MSEQTWNIGDCLDLLPGITDKSIDMILTDLPYGTTACSWDTVIPFEPLWEQYKRIIKDNGAIVLTASQPFTSALIMSNIDMFKYELIWDKKFGIPTHAKIRPMKTHENILIFSKNTTLYNPQMINRRKKIHSGGNNCTSITSPLTKKEGWKKEYNVKFPISILNYPRNIGNTVHPTQKPVALFEYLIKTYTNEGDMVHDSCLGSDTTLEACMNTNRNCIGFEISDEWVPHYNKRLKSDNSKLMDFL